jgi:peptidoglycan/LPS O-acetylase OafA/YrhL
VSDALKYRPEIDGLRALAVVAVIVFHFHAHFLPGGFLGVDVFFVISGFLITSIIHRQLEDGSFSLRAFWMRRIRRLYPALFFMVGIVALLGYLLILRPERGELTLHSIAALCSFQNILLWKTTGGYWAESSENIALLHTWSLSLEEQFYVVFPPVLLLVHRFARRWILPLIVAMALVSLLLCLQQTGVRRNAAFYFLPTRMWELLLGSIAAITTSGSSLKRGAFRFGGIFRPWA